LTSFLLHLCNIGSFFFISALQTTVCRLTQLHLRHLLSLLTPPPPLYPAGSPTMLYSCTPDRDFIHAHLEIRPGAHHFASDSKLVYPPFDSTPHLLVGLLWLDHSPLHLLWGPPWLECLFFWYRSCSYTVQQVIIFFCPLGYQLEDFRPGYFLCLLSLFLLRRDSRVVPKWTAIPLRAYVLC